MYIAIGAMILVLVGMLVAKNNLANSPMLQPLLFLCVMVELGLVIYVLYDQFGRQNGVAANYERREWAKGFVAGRFLAASEGTRGRKLLIINSSGAGDNRYARALRGALKAQYGSLIEDEVKDNSPEGDYIAPAAKDIEEVLQRHPEAEVVAFADNTLPEDYGQLNVTKIFLFDRGSADLGQVRKDVAEGRIAGVILPRKGVRFKGTDKVETDPEEAFKKRYVLIDKSNLDANAAYFE